MKRLSYIRVLVIPIVFMFFGCGGAQLTTASSSPTRMTLPASLASNSDAIYYNKLLNQYIIGLESVPTKEKDKNSEYTLSEKEQKKLYFQSFENSGLSRQDALKAYRKQQKVGWEKALVELPKGAITSNVAKLPNNTLKIGKRYITTKESSTLYITYEFKNKEDIIKKYREFVLLFEKLLPSQQWKKTTEKTTADSYRKMITNMENFYNKYKGNYNVLPDPKGYKKNIQTYKEMLKKTLERPMSIFKYTWSSTQNVPNTMMVIIKPIKILRKKDILKKDFTFDFINNSTDFDGLSVGFTKTLY